MNITNINALIFHSDSVLIYSHIRSLMSKRVTDNNITPRLISPKNPYLCHQDSKCNICNKHTNTVTMLNGIFWAKQYICHPCYLTWTICKICRVRNQRMYCIRDVMKHDNKFHRVPSIEDTRYISNEPINPCNLYFSDNDNNGLHLNSSSVPTSSPSFLQKLGSQSLETLTFETFILENSVKYFSNLHHNNHLHSIILGSLNHDADETDKISPTDLSLHTTYCSLAYRLSPKERVMLATLVSKVIDHTMEVSSHPTNQPTSTKISNFTQTKIPTTPNEIRCNYLDRMISKLPRPNIEIDKNHAFISVTELLRHVFAFGIECQPLLPQENILCPVLSSDQCKMSQDFLRQSIVDNDGKMKCMTVLMTDWHDDFEPNSQSKQNRGSVWVYTVTLLGPDGTKNKAKYTYPVAIGNKSCNHDHIFAKVQNEIKKLQDGETFFYHRGLKKMIPVNILHLVSIADSPERRGKNYISLGNGEYTSRWGYSANVNFFAHKLPYCDTCLHRMLVTRIPVNAIHCSNCLRWNFDDTENPLIQSPLPKTHPNSPSMILPKNLTFEYLTRIIGCCVRGLVNSSLTLKQCISMIKCSGLNEEMVTRIKDFANSDQIDDSLENEIVLSIIDGIVPPQWKHKSGFLNESYIDAIMHLIFYGTGGSSIGDITKFLKLKKKHASFISKVNELTDEITNMRLSWCKLLPYKNGTFGAWVAENWIAYLRICKWIYSSIHIITDDEKYVPPTTAQDKWTKKQNVEWLKVRGLLCDGSAKELKEKVHEYINDVDGTPSVLPPIGGSINNISNLVTTMARMISLVMTKEVTPSILIEVDVGIKIYLSMVHKFDIALNGTINRKLTWVQKSNYLSLLNLPNQMKMYGPMRCYWEGGYRGEGLIQELKSIINQGLVKNWQKNTLKRFFNLRTLSLLNKETKNGDSNDTEKESQYKDFKRYGTISNIIDVMQNNKPLSIMESKKNYFLVAIDSKSAIQIVIKNYSNTICHMDYFFWRIMPDIIIPKPLSNEIVRNCILLPCLDKEINWVNYNGVFGGIYSCIDSDWNELTNEKGFIIPRSIDIFDIC